ERGVHSVELRERVRLAPSSVRCPLTGRGGYSSEGWYTVHFTHAHVAPSSHILCDFFSYWDADRNTFRLPGVR
ncbi:hypothetical protein KI387_017771, partial [Taxus chinensis]